jgi:hypothetical protein
MKTMITAAALALAAAGLGGCAGMPAGGQNLTGFPIDEKCAEFYGRSPLYAGNLALAYSGNCVSVGM